MSSVTSTVGASALSALANTPATTQVGPQANQTQMNQFLTLLTTQMKNQDPTQPTDPTQFIAQLAQFSTVEQLVQSNTTLTAMSKALSGLALGQYAGLINRTVSAAVSSMTVPASGGVSTPMAFNVNATSLKDIRVQITNAAGAVVGLLPVSGSAGTVMFDGTDGQGRVLPAGQYGVSLVGTSGTGSTAAVGVAGTLSTAGTVSGVVQDGNGGWQLQMKNGQVIDASSITAAS